MGVASCWVVLVIIIYMYMYMYYYFLGNSLSSLPRHSSTPEISGNRANIASDTSAAASNFPRAELLKVHG